MNLQQSAKNDSNDSISQPGRIWGRRLRRAARWVLAGAVGVTLAAAIPQSWFSTSLGAPATAPTTAESAAGGAAATTQPSMEEIQKQLQDDGQQLGKIVGSFQDLINPAKRTELAPKALPLMRHMITLLNQAEQVQVMAAPQIERQKSQFLVIMAVLGDQGALDTLNKQTESKDPTVARSAKTSLLLVHWWHDPKDVAAQKKVLDDARALAKLMPDDEELAGKLAVMYEQGAASPEIRADLAKIVTDELKGEGAQQIAQQIAEQAKLQSVVDKPMTITGTTVDGKAFSTADWKGKVILVDFWATWCPPCREELPNVIKAYNTYHDKGLEILGVSNDYSADDLKTFVTDHKDMPWPQLFDAKAAADHKWNPITLGYGIDGIPTMFLIDREGVCRSVEARGNLDTLIPGLLEKK